MRHHILYLLFLVPHLATAQLCPPQDETANNFDWTTPYFNCQVRSTLTQIVDTTVIPSPFNSDYYHPNTQVFAADPTGRFFHPDYGWELVTAQMGWPAAVRWPSFSLYNRYTGVFRQFFYARDLEEAELIEVYLGFDHRLIPFAPAVFSHFEGAAPALEAYENNGFSVFSRMVYQPGLEGVWIWGASNTAYDPCTCLHPSNLLVTTTSYTQKGGYVDFDPQDGIMHYLPGSEPPVGGVSVRRPTYNEIMGVFNLMETPSVWQAKAHIGKEYTDRGCQVLSNHSFQLQDSLRFAMTLNGMTPFCALQHQIQKRLFWLRA
ncbi:MAG: hypothetical protein GVY26_03820 [Bacteroidetes bacterium]|jgi:hypothetical protein|nr:hypothetical protein [Bacteroidota bacterium]